MFRLMVSFWWMNTSCVWLSCHLTLLLRCHYCLFALFSLSQPLIFIDPSLLFLLFCITFGSSLSTLSLPLDACSPVIFYLLYLPAISYPLFCSPSLTAFGMCWVINILHFGWLPCSEPWEVAYMACTDVMQYQCICKKLSGKVRVTGKCTGLLTICSVTIMLLNTDLTDLQRDCSCTLIAAN